MAVEIREKIIPAQQLMDEYIPLIQQGLELPLTVTGSSMLPFLVPKRDAVLLCKPPEVLRRGDIVLFRRAGGEYILHRIWRVQPDGLYIIGDNQRTAEGPVKPCQVAAAVSGARRRGKIISPDSPVWWFYAKIWLRIIPFRRVIMRFGIFIRRHTAKSRH